MSWFRWYVDTTTDGKMRTAARKARASVSEVLAVWAVLLEDARRAADGGRCGCDVDYIAAVLDLENGVTEEILVAMQALDMVSLADDAITVTHWSSRQYETDQKDPTAAQRKRRFRDRQRSAVPTAEADANDSVGDAERNGNGGGTAEERAGNDQKAEHRVGLVGCLTREGEADDSGAPPPEPPAPADAPEATTPPSAAPTAADVLELIVTANAAMRQNPAIDPHRLRPIPEHHAGSVQVIADWMAAGISLDTAAEVIQRVAQHEYRPSERSKQINSLSYFDGAVRDAHALATGAPRPKRGGARGGGGIPRRSPRPDEYVPTTTVATW